MDTIETARTLGKAIQNDDRYAAYIGAKIKNDDDPTLQEKIGEFNLLRQNLQMESSRPETEKNAEKIKELNASMRLAYDEVMSNANMADFTKAKTEFDKLLNDINQIINCACLGEDPDAWQLVDCGGSCSSCKGCG